MRILIAPNAFKNSLSAALVAEFISEGLQSSKLKCNCIRFPIGDGGDGTAILIVESCKGTWVSHEIMDPLERKVISRFGLIDEGHTGVIEMADASGLKLLKPEELNPLRANSFGTGQLIKQALDKKVSKIIIGLGGSATVDGATGILSALGVRFLDSDGKLLPPYPEELIALHSIDLEGLDKRIFNCELRILCDVNNKLLGAEGAAAVFGRQKGANSEAIKKLNGVLTRISEVAYAITGRDMSAMVSGGAAGGAAAGIAAFLNGKLENGIDHFLDITFFDHALASCDLVITGEGSIDSQTLHGKGPLGVARRAKRIGIPVIALAGRVPLYGNTILKKYFDVLFPVGNEPSPLEEALQTTGDNLRRTAREIGNMLTFRN